MCPRRWPNYLCLLGWSPKDNREVLALGEVRAIFTLDTVNRRSAIFDLDKVFLAQRPSTSSP